MAITNINITQDNIGDLDLIAIHNPLVFEAEVDYTSTAPDTVTVNVYDDADVLLGTYDAIYKEDVDADTRKFMFIADKILKSLMPSFDEVLQNNLSVRKYADLTKKFTIEFIDGTNFDDCTFFALNAARQFGEKPSIDEYNDNETIYVPKGEIFYTYYYCDNSADAIKINNLSNDSFKGVYRYAHTSTADETLIWYKNNTPVKTVTVKTLEKYTNDLIIKYLDTKGRYCVINFNSYYEKKINTKEIGVTNPIITNILTDQSNEINLGVNSNPTITAYIDQITVDHLLQLTDLQISPRVYLKQNDTWLLVSLKSSSPVRMKKGNMGSMEIEINLPKMYSINSI